MVWVTPEFLRCSPDPYVISWYSKRAFFVSINGAKVYFKKKGIYRIPENYNANTAIELVAYGLTGSVVVTIQIPDNASIFSPLFSKYINSISCIPKSSFSKGKVRLNERLSKVNFRNSPGHAFGNPSRVSPPIKGFNQKLRIGLFNINAPKTDFFEVD